MSDRPALASSPSEQALAQLLRRRYRFIDPQLQPLRVLPGRGIYTIASKAAPRCVLRACAGASSANELATQAQVLRFLQDQRFPASRLVPAVDGAGIVLDEGWCLLVTSYTEGAVATFEPAHLHQLGRVLGTLHVLDTPDASDFPVSEWHPDFYAYNAVVGSDGRLSVIDWDGACRRRRNPPGGRSRVAELMKLLGTLHRH